MSDRNRGKNTGDESLFSLEKQKYKLKQAVLDMNYLVSRGYSEKASSELVGNRYKLKTRQIQSVRGMSASDAQLQNRKSKEINALELKDKTVSLDGFNVLILLESLLSDAYVFKGQDGFFRDLSCVHGTYKRVNQTFYSIELIARFFEKTELDKLVWIFDKPVFNSGRIQQIVMDFANNKNLNWEVDLQYNPDKYLVENFEIIVSSDAWVLDHCKKTFNLIQYLITEEKREAYLIKLFEE